MATGTRSLAADLRRSLPANQVFDGVEDRTLCAYDGTSLKALPDAIAHVRSAAEVSAVLRFASDHEVPVVPRGAGTGLSGGSVPAQGGIALVLAGMRSIKEIVTSSMMAVVEPGVITGVFQKTVEDAGLFYPRIRPASITARSAGTSRRMPAARTA